MSRTFKYRQIQPPPEGEALDYQLGRTIHDYLGAEWGESSLVVRGDPTHHFIKGLRAAGMEGATELDEAITRLGTVELFVAF